MTADDNTFKKGRMPLPKSLKNDDEIVFLLKGKGKLTMNATLFLNGFYQTRRQYRCTTRGDLPTTTRRCRYLPPTLLGPVYGTVHPYGRLHRNGIDLVTVRTIVTDLDVDNKSVLPALHGMNIHFSICRHFVFKLVARRREFYLHPGTCGRG